MKRITDYMFLPPQITDFERNYLAKLNKVGLWFFVGHLPLLILLAALNGTGPLLALGLTSLVLVGPLLAYKTFANPRMISVTYGFTAMVMGGLLVHFGQGPIQIEMHFYFFVLLALLAVYANPAVVVTAAVTVAIHHLAFWMFLPASVFNYAAPIWVVGVHAAFVVLESVAACFIARSFFDNVIGLEKIVEARTSALNARNQDMRVVLDNVEQGLLTLDKEGIISPEHSAIVERWFPLQTEGARFDALLNTANPDVAAAFRVGWDEVVNGFLPLEVTLDQLPHQIEADGRTLHLEYKPILEGEELRKVLVVMSDVTAAHERERLEREQRDTMRVLSRISKDKQGFVEFYEEAEELLRGLRGPQDLTLLKRRLHTLKGNAAIFGIQTLADACHDLESAMEEEQRGPNERELHDLAERWSRLKESLSLLLGEEQRSTVEIADDQFQNVLRALLNKRPHDEIAGIFASWKLEPTARRLTRLGEQAKTLARRLGKGELAIHIEDNGIRLDPKRWATFWSAFVHAVRNAVDHGIESPEARAAAQKPEEGSLTLSTALLGDTLEIVIQDDGAGIDWARIAAKAQARGLPTASRDDLQEALFADGLSSREEASELSGRGVGMGALRAECARLGGSIKIDSQPNHGTSLRFRFPAKSYQTKPQTLLQHTA